MGSKERAHRRERRLQEGETLGEAVDAAIAVALLEFVELLNLRLQNGQLERVAVPVTYVTYVTYVTVANLSASPYLLHTRRNALAKLFHALQNHSRYANCYTLYTRCYIKNAVPASRLEPLASNR